MQNRLIVGQGKTRATSNESTAIPEWLEILAVKGCIGTIEARGCQTEIAAQIIAQGAEYGLALKGNHGKVPDQVVEFFDQLDEQEHQPVVQEEDIRSYETGDGDHGRIEIRRDRQVSDVQWLVERAQWKALQRVGMVEAERQMGETVSGERRYDLSSLGGNVHQFAEAVRGHWSIENALHWSLDVSFREDDSRIRKGYAPENVAVLRHIALNLLKQDPHCKKGIKPKRLKAGWDNNYLADLLFSGG